MLFKLPHSLLSLHNTPSQTPSPQDYESVRLVRSQLARFRGDMEKEGALQREEVTKLVAGGSRRAARHGPAAYCYSERGACGDTRAGSYQCVSLSIQTGG